MKATFDIPDELYRRVKARSAMEGRPVRAVAVELFEKWLGSGKPETEEDLYAHLTEEDYEEFPWLKTARKYVKPGMSHNWDDIKESIAIGWGKEASEKLAALEEKEAVR